MVIDRYDLRPDEVRLLADGCREADIIERLEAELADAPLMVKGSMGQLVASPLVSEVRQHRAVLAGLLKSLKLPDAPAEAQDVARPWYPSRRVRQPACDGGGARGCSSVVHVALAEQRLPLATDGLPAGMPSGYGIPTLGWGVLAWAEEFLAQPDGP